MYLPDISVEDVTQGQNFKQSKAGLNSEFPFPILIVEKTVCHTIFPSRKRQEIDSYLSKMH